MQFKRLCSYALLLISLSLWLVWYYQFQQQELFNFIEHHDYKIIGVIASLPEYKNHHLSFTFKLKQLDNKSAYQTLQLNWYGKSPYLTIGDTWLLEVKLKHLSNISISNDFDYGSWLKDHGISAVGYVSTSTTNQLLQPSSQWNLRNKLDKCRLAINQQIWYLLKNSNYAAETGLISGLTVGIRTDVSKAQWAAFENTGTVHLMAIAGLHIGFLAGFFFYLIKWLWSRSEKLLLCFPAQKVGIIAALLAALIYALLAGFALPTQRAFIMISIMSLAKLSNRNISMIQIFILAAVLILLWDPLAIISTSFWLSFAAVGFIFYGINGRVNLQKNVWRHWFQIQWFLTIGLMPFMLWFFQQSSFVGLIANALAIPIVGFIAIPLCLMGCIFIGINHHIAHGILISAAFVLHYLMQMLTYFSFLPYAVWHFQLTSFWQFFTMLLAVILLLTPRGLAVRWLGLVLMICVLLV